MQNKNHDIKMEAKKEKEFEYNGVKYIARIRENNYGEIVYKDNLTRPKSMKDVIRQYLKKYNIEISTDTNRMTTHSAIRILLKHI